MPVLFPFLKFDQEETPISFAARLAWLHTSTSLAPFLRDIEVKGGELLGGKDHALERLATVSGVNLADLRRNSAQSLGSRWFNLRGNLLSAEFFASPHTVFCPACLREDDKLGGDPALVRRGRLLWTLRPVRTCPVHGLALVRRKKIAWDDAFHQLALRVPERADALDKLVDGASRQSPSPLQDYVIARLEGGAGPSWLDSQSLEQAVRATEMLGLLLEYGPKAKPGDLDDIHWEAAGRAGYEVTARGEEGIREALRAVQADFLMQGGKPDRGNVLGALYRWLASRKNRKEPGDIRRIMREHIFDTTEIAAGEIILGGSLTERRLHSVQSLATESGLHPKTLRNVLAASELIPGDAKVSANHVFDAKVGRKLATSVPRAISVSKLGDALGCTRPQADQLLDERLLLPLAGGPKESAGRIWKSVGKDAVDQFLVDLHASARSVFAVPADMVSISKAAEKARALSVEIVHLILGGFLENIARLQDVHGYRALLVDPAEVRIALAAHMPGLSASAVFGKLRIPKSVGWALVHRETEPRLRATVIDANNGRHRFYRFDDEAVASFMSEFTTVIRIANQHKLERKDVISRLRGMRVRPVISRQEIGLDFYRVADLPEFEPA